jgi:hypothetical protein
MLCFGFQFITAIKCSAKDDVMITLVVQTNAKEGIRE